MAATMAKTARRTRMMGKMGLETLLDGVSTLFDL
jgi:hypothetical protein